MLGSKGEMGAQKTFGTIKGVSEQDHRESDGDQEIKRWMMGEEMMLSGLELFNAKSQPRVDL